MRIIDAYGMKPDTVTEDGASKVTIRQLITADTQAPNFAMRLFELQTGGNTPYHTHAWEHEVFILKGKGEIVTEEGPRPFKAGDAVLVLPEEKHQFRNNGSEAVNFICIIPIQGKCLDAIESVRDQLAALKGSKAK